MLERWELHHAAIGEVTETGELRAFFEDEAVGEIPAAFLTDECPRYEVDAARGGVGRAPGRPGQPRAEGWIFEQYDQLVHSRTVRRPGLDAAVLQLRPVVARASRSRSTARRPAAAIPARPAAQLCSTPRATSPAPAASRSR